jgi:hypothetical protein
MKDFKELWLLDSPGKAGRDGAMDATRVGIADAPRAAHHEEQKIRFHSTRLDCREEI